MLKNDIKNNRLRLYHSSILLSFENQIEILNFNSIINEMPSLTFIFHISMLRKKMIKLLATYVLKKKNKKKRFLRL